MKNDFPKCPDCGRDPILPPSYYDKRGGRLAGAGLYIHAGKLSGFCFEVTESCLVENDPNNPYNQVNGVKK